MHISIWFREDGSEAWAGRIGDRLRGFFGPHVVSLCQVDRGRVTVDKSAILLLIIGPETLRRMLSASDDPLFSAELLFGGQVIPLYVAGTTVPDSGSIPEKLKSITTLPHLEMRHRSFEEDIGRLVDLLCESVIADTGYTGAEGEQADSDLHATSTSFDRESWESELPSMEPGTSCVAFVGPTLRGPTEDVRLVVNFDDYRRLYGGFDDIEGQTNQMAYAADAFFKNGGRRLFVSRVVSENAATAFAEIAGSDAGATFTASEPGSGGNCRIKISEVARPASRRLAESAPIGSVLRYHGELFLKQESGWISKTGDTVVLPEEPDADFCLITLKANVRDQRGFEETYSDLALSSDHPSWIGYVLGSASSPDESALVTLSLNDHEPWPGDLLDALFQFETPAVIELVGGSDGYPSVSEFANALERLVPMEELDVVAAPGFSDYCTYSSIQSILISHAEATKRLTVLELPADVTVDTALVERARVDSCQAMLCYPWLWAEYNHISQPAKTVMLPPTGFVCGLLAENDPGTGTHKPLTNQRIRGARPHTVVSSENENLLIPQGVNCIRLFPGAGCRLRGGRTASSDPQWRHVTARRYQNYIEREIGMILNWAVSESVDEQLMASVEEQVRNLLRREWLAGRLFGATEEVAFSVRCDETTNSQQDIDAGKLNVNIVLSLTGVT